MVLKNFKIFKHKIFKIFKSFEIIIFKTFEQFKTFKVETSKIYWASDHLNNPCVCLVSL